MPNDINKIFVNVSKERGSEFINTYSTTYQGTGTAPERDTSRDSQVAFLTSYGTIVTHGEVVTGGLKADVLVAGGPLANNIAESGDEWPSEWIKDGNKCIPANTDLQTLISKLFLKEKYNTVSVSKSNTADWAAPSFTLKRVKDNSTLNNDSVIEYGENVQMTTASAGAITAGTFTRSITQSNGNYGMFVNGVYKTSYSETKNGTQSGDITLSYYAGSTSISLNSDVQLTANTTFKVSESGITSTSANFTATTTYNSSNIKTKGNQYVSWDADTDSKTLSKDATRTIKVSRYMFVGTETTYRTTEPTATEIRALSIINGPEATGTFKKNLPTCKTMIYAIPSNRTLTKCYATSTAGAVDFVSKMILKTISVPGANGSAGTNYNVYYYSSEGDFGNEEFTFVIA